ncbi:MAG: carbohydrate kinase family protein [Blastocatellia bacterium]|nr:carbohydrate kinase family protein [Blastocatellia bacterium]
MHFPISLPKDRKFNVTGFGTNAVDFLIQVPNYPAFNSKVELLTYTRAPGGEVATTLAGLSRLGFRTSYVGRFGDDDAGHLGLESLTKEGVDVSAAEQIKGAKTQIAFIIIDERTGERTVIWQRDEKLGYREDEVDPALAEDCQVLHFTPHDTSACIRLAQAARNTGTVVSIDIDRTFEGVDRLLPLVDVLIASSDFARSYTGVNDERESLAALAQNAGSAVAGVTLGERGSLLYVKGDFILTPGFPVPGGCKDTTGAGDSFRTGLLAGILKGESLKESARMGNAVAALKCRAVGARTSLPTPEELDAILKKM